MVFIKDSNPLQTPATQKSSTTTTLSSATSSSPSPESNYTHQQHKERRWHLVLGTEDEQEPSLLSADEQRMSKALNALYKPKNDSSSDKKEKGGLGRSAPRVSRWLGDIREFFPSSVVQVIQKDAFERLGLKSMLLEPEFLSAMEADVHLVADLISLRSAMPNKTIETARQVIKQVVDELIKKLARRTQDSIRGALNRSKRNFRPSFKEIDWPRTIQSNLRHYQASYQTVIPEKLIGYQRQSRRSIS